MSIDPLEMTDKERLAAALFPYVREAHCRSTHASQGPCGRACLCWAKADRAADEAHVSIFGKPQMPVYAGPFQMIEDGER